VKHEALCDAYQLPLVGQPYLPVAVQERVTVPVLSFLMTKT